MERKNKQPIKKKESSPVLSWVKNGGGTFHTKSGKRIKPGQIFQAREEEIPKAFRDNIILVTEADMSERERKRKRTTKENVPVIEPVKSDFTVVEREDGIFDVVDGQGKAINEQGLSKEEAEELLITLQ